MPVQSLSPAPPLANSQASAGVETTAATLAQTEGSVQESSNSNVGAGIVVALLFGGALYAICRSSRRG